MASNRIIKNLTWENILSMNNYNWIIIGDVKYQFLKNELINRFFPVLAIDDKNLLLKGLVLIINFIFIKFGFHYEDIDENILWEQLKQNDLLDFRAILLLMLPFINDNETDDKKRKLKKLEDLYLEMDEKGQYVYSNSQYNRCIRYNDGEDINYLKRPFLKEYFLQHLELLLMSIETVSNKLYVNWVDVIPIKMNKYKETHLYENTIVKIINRGKSYRNVMLINNYIDLNGGISYQDFYNVISNHLFNEIKNHKWLIYDIIIGEKPISYVAYLESIFSLDTIWNNLLWSQLTKNETNKFTYQWNNFLNSYNIYNNTVLHHFYFFFSKYHKNSVRLIKQGKLILTGNPTEDEEENEENIRITPETTRNAITGMSKVPIEEIYLFFYDQFSAFKKSWYYYMIKIRKDDHLAKNKIDKDGPDTQTNTIYVTPKNIYNYCKSMVHYVNTQKKFVQIPKHWYSLSPEQIEMVLIRMLDIENITNDPFDPKRNNWRDPKGNWFNINKYIKRFYPFVVETNLAQINLLLHTSIREKIVDIIFESLIYHGLLSEFRPNKKITNNTIIESSIGSTDDIQKTNHKRDQMKSQYFSGQNRKEFEKYAYYYVTSTTYGELSPIRSKDYIDTNYQKKYFDFLTSNQIWTFTYAMNWISQINFYHHYINNRIMYVTGATGVGKSTQVPKLLMYSQKMIDYNANGKIICTQPRVPPTIENAGTISKELGVPIGEYSSLYDRSIFTSNYYIQYKHQKEQHVEKMDSFLRIVTDGTLYEEMKKSPFMTRLLPDQAAVDANGKKIEWAQLYSTGNKYDIIIVDEAHEHNPNMDMILTLARDVTYVNNSIKLVIISATMDDDEPLYRRYYRKINDNRTFPLSAFIQNQILDRANMDRRLHISAPGATTQYVVKDIYLPKPESDLINELNFVDYGIKKTIWLANSTTQGDILLFMSGQADIHKAVKEINDNTPVNIIAIGYYSELSEETKESIVKIHQTLSYYTRYKDDVFLEEADVTRRVPSGTYTRAIIIATNVAEASITLQNLKYVIDTGYAKMVVYDPLEGISKILTLPISQSSSIQRRGRVGRVASGEVYYLYDKEKIVNNKTAYKIADINIKDTIVSLLKSDPQDNFIITAMNDINYIPNLEKIIDLKTSNEYEPEYLIYDVLKNPRSYLDIIKKQYLYIPDISDITQYYTYYGKTNMQNYDGKKLLNNFKKYLIENHDDYHYQEKQDFLSRSHTGYDDFILRDDSLSFYIIHPDENVIKRNLYTGKMEGIKCNLSVSNAYYYYLLNINNISVNTQDILTCNFRNIDFDRFSLIKYYLAIDEAKLQLLIIDVPGQYIDRNIEFTNIVDPVIKKYTNDYIKYINHYFTISPELTINIKSNILNKLNDIKSTASIQILNDLNYLLWYAYSIPYGIENDVVALITFISLAPNINQWIGDLKSKNNVKRFFTMHMTEKGDIYFLWKLWNTIKKLIEKENLFEITKINIETEIQFKNYKERYLKKSKIPYDQFLIFDKMFKSGKLNVDDEFFYYVDQLSIDFKELIKKNVINKYLDIISKNNNFDSEKIKEFLVEYLDILFTLNKRIWTHRYEIENQINETENIMEEIDVFDWAKSKLSFPGINNNPHYLENTWDRVLETYIRAFSINLLKNEGDYYLQINRGVRMDPAYWSKKIILEKTFLNNKMDYIIYHNNETTGRNNNVTYLTPVKLEWVLDLNPIYYYYFFFDKENILYKMKEDDDINKVINIINSNKYLFSFKSLISYLDLIENPVISGILRNEMNNLLK